MTAAALDAAEGFAPLSVVLIDDTPDIRLLLKVVLDGSGRFTVVGEAGDGRTGVELVRTHRPDAVILDLAMPVMDGIEALGIIGRVSPGTRSVVLSAFESNQMGERAMRAGAVAYVQKGASAKRILAAVCAALEVPEPGAAVRPALVDPSAALSSELDRMHAALAGAAHELRGPATVLLAMTELLSTERDALDRGTFNRMLDAIRRQAHVLDRVTGDLLTSTQSQRGVLTVDVEPMLLRPLVEGAALGLGDRIDVRIDCAPELCVLADATRVQQMLGNLLSNAVKYGAAPVEIIVRDLADRVLVRVVDHGAGVPAEFRDRLFGQFARAAGTRVNGMGLGLFVVRSLTEAQGGQVWYESLDGGGSAFCFTLPLAQVPVGASGGIVPQAARSGS